MKNGIWASAGIHQAVASLSMPLSFCILFYSMEYKWKAAFDGHCKDNELIEAWKACINKISFQMVQISSDETAPSGKSRTGEGKFYFFYPSLGSKDNRLQKKKGRKYSDFSFSSSISSSVSNWAEKKPTGEIIVSAMLVSGGSLFGGRCFILFKGANSKKGEMSWFFQYLSTIPCVRYDMEERRTQVLSQVCIITGFQ